MPPEAEALSLNTPAADQPPPEHKPAESFDKRYASMQAKLGISDDDPEPAGVEEAEAPPEEKPKRNTEGTAGDAAMLEALAKKLGKQVVDPGSTGVKPSERMAWEQAKKRQEEGLSQREAKVRELEQSIQGNDRVKKSEAILSAIENGDPEGFAAAVGRKDFNEFQQEFIKRLADPNYKELRQLRQQLEEREKGEKETAERTKREQQEMERNRQRNAYLSDLAGKAKASADAVAAALHDDPLFTPAIFNVQKHLHNLTGEIPTIEAALDAKIDGFPKTLREELRANAERFLKAFPDLRGTVTEAAPKNGKKIAPRTAVTPANTTAVASAPKSPGEMSSLEWREYTKKRYAEAGD